MLLAWAFAELRPPGGARAFPALAAALVPAAPRLGPKLAANALWAFAVAGHLDETLRGALHAALARVDPRALPGRALMQLAQAEMVAADAYAGVIGAGAGAAAAGAAFALPSHLRALARRRWRASVRRGSGGGVSAMQRAVVAALRALGADPRLESLTRDGMLRVDAALAWRGRRVAVEVDGPHHFTLTSPRRPLGRTVARRRCLQARGFAVLSVPFYEWRAVSRGGGGSSGDSGDGDGEGGGSSGGRDGGREEAGALGRQVAYLRAALDAAAASAAPHTLHAAAGDDEEEGNGGGGVAWGRYLAPAAGDDAEGPDDYDDDGYGDDDYDGYGGGYDGEAGEDDGGGAAAPADSARGRAATGTVPSLAWLLDGADGGIGGGALDDDDDDWL